MLPFPFKEPAISEAQKWEGPFGGASCWDMRPQVPAPNHGRRKARSQAGPQSSFLLQMWGWRICYGLAVPGGCGLV